MKKISLKKLLVISYGVLILFVLAIFGWRSYLISANELLDMAQENICRLIDDRNRIQDMTFGGIEEASQRVLVDKEIYELLDTVNLNNQVALAEANEELAAILQRYFMGYDQIISVALVTEAYTFGYWTDSVTFGPNFLDSSLYQKAAAQEGRTFYAPTYNYYAVSSGKQLENNSQNMVLSMIRVADFLMAEDSGKLHPLNRFEKEPALIISFRDSIYRQEMQALTSEEGAEYVVFDGDRNVVSHSRQQFIGERYQETWAQEEALGERGSLFADVEGKPSLVCYASSDRTGWLSAVMIPREALLHEVLGEIRGNIIVIALLSLILSIGISAALMHYVTGTLQQMVVEAERLGKGEFDGKRIQTGIREFARLADSLHETGKRLKRLIKENYVIKIRQQENEIAILTTQLNPHFLSNTLNIIQMANLTGDRRKTGKMIVALSRMLNYTMYNREEMKLLRDDMEWLEQYIFIMNCRYDNEFEIMCRMDEDIMEELVPKLFLQPILENSILHAFTDKETGGRITITGKRDGESGKLLFEVEDNGAGMSETQVAGFFKESSGAIGIKNVYQRLRLIYGEDCEFEIKSRIGYGTRTVIRIPDGEKKKQRLKET